MVDGSDAEIARSEAILNHRGIEEWGVYDIPGTKAASGDRSSASVMPAATVSSAGTTAQAVRKFEERQIGQSDNESAHPISPVSTSATTPSVLEHPGTNNDSVKLYEERLVVDKDREKTGEVAIGKRVETETVRASVPIEKERVVIERHSTGDGTPVTPGTDAFQDSQAVRMEVYEESPDFQKEAFVREEIKVRKEVDRETVNAEETLRREELKIDTQGQPVVETRPNDIRTDRA
ncbi:YsnF/AvaK domain-containing protein [Phormidium sp. CLA17]|nr:YsnF/AvaK domain-containing protein [Leptolyngbya sp. Cla-17]